MLYSPCRIVSRWHIIRSVYYIANLQLFCGYMLLSVWSSFSSLHGIIDAATRRLLYLRVCILYTCRRVFYHLSATIHGKHRNLFPLIRIWLLSTSSMFRSLLTNITHVISFLQFSSIVYFSANVHRDYSERSKNHCKHPPWVYRCFGSLPCLEIRWLQIWWNCDMYTVRKICKFNVCKSM